MAPRALREGLPQRGEAEILLTRKLFTGQLTPGAIVNWALDGLILY